MNVRAVLTLAFLALALASSAADRKKKIPDFVTVPIDLKKSPIKDQRDSSCRPDLGYAGCLTEVSLYNEAFGPWAYGPGAAATEAAFKACGAKFIRQWNAIDEWQRGMAGEGNRASPKACYSLWKKCGARVLLTIENYGVFVDKKLKKRSSDIEDLKRVIAQYMDWIVKNKFTDVVAGFEMGNEAYFGNDPETYAARVEAIIPIILKAMPEAKIGIPIAEYRAGDPDLDVVRKRLGEKKMMAGGGEFSLNRLNQWSGRFVTALSNQMDKVTHVIYHFYGGDGAYGCSAAGFDRIRKFAEVYPQLKGKRVWISEWRERSDEDQRCHQMFFSTLWKAHYMLLALSRQEVDGINLHCLGCLAGGLNIGMNCSYYQGCPWIAGFFGQSDPLGGYNVHPDPDGGVGIRHYEVGPAGPLFKMYTDALMEHPIILERGTLTGGAGPNVSLWSSALYYGSARKRLSALASGAKELPPVMGNVDWVATCDPDRKSVALLMVNSCEKPQKVLIQCKGGRFTGTVKTVELTCPPEHVFSHGVPGEPPLWTLREFDRKLPGSGKVELSIPGDCVQVLTLAL